MTILLHDVQYLLQIPVEGRLMSRTSEQLDHPEVGLCALLGMNSEQLSGQPFLCSSVSRPSQTD
ncbi:unnamed protein product [Linum tenue]|uniref:Uncharacterized protein n=1 Tax=Linum tenue TaxID=586396 RepID=A0AAV0LN90_9ROSI|nr:unnamed protein product [Linum tenue]